MQDLKTYLAARGISQAAFAAEIGSDQTMVSRLCRRKVKPGLDMAFRIQRATGGAVPAEVWADQSDPHVPDLIRDRAPCCAAPVEPDPDVIQCDENQKGAA